MKTVSLQNCDNVSQVTLSTNSFCRRKAPWEEWSCFHHGVAVPWIRHRWPRFPGHLMCVNTGVPSSAVFRSHASLQVQVKNHFSYTLLQKLKKKTLVMSLSCSSSLQNSSSRIIYPATAGVRSGSGAGRKWEWPSCRGNGRDWLEAAPNGLISISLAAAITVLTDRRVGQEGTARR